MANDERSARGEEKSARVKQIEERKQRMAELTPRNDRVRVTAKNDEIRKSLKHPHTSAAFPEDGGSVEWPLDQFTKRRIRDGPVTREKDREPPRPQGHGHRRPTSPEAA